jgi:hypothetical protein
MLGPDPASLGALAGAGRYVPAADSARPDLLGIAWRVAQRGFRQRAGQVRLRRRLGAALPRLAADEADAVAAAIDAARLSPELARAVRRLPSSLWSRSPPSPRGGTAGPTGS